MARAVFEIAKDFQDKIFGDLDQARKFQTDARDSVLADFQVPEKLSATRLANMNNQFALQDRANTFATDLTANGLNSQTGLRQAQLDASTFDSKAQLERLAIENKMIAEQKAKQEYIGLAKNAEANEELLKLKLEEEITGAKATIMENMSSFEKYQAESEYNTIMNEIPDWETLPQGQRVMLTWDKAKGKTISKKGLSLIKLKLREELSDELATLQYFDEVLTAKNTATTVAGVAKFNAVRNKFILSLRGLDTQTLAFAVGKGILSASDFNPVMFEAIVNGTNPNAVANIGDPNADPAAAQAGQPIQDAGVAAAPAPAQPAAAEPPVPSEAPAPETVVPSVMPEQIAMDSDMSLKEVNDAISSMPGESQAVILKVPASPAEAISVIENLKAIGAFQESQTGAKNNDLIMKLLIARIVNITETFSTGGN